MSEATGGQAAGLTALERKWAKSVGSVAAPLLAGFSFTAVVVVSEDPEKFRWADATILSLTLAVVTLIGAVQTSKYVHKEQRRAAFWYGLSRLLYHPGIISLLLGVGFVLAPLHVAGESDVARWVACGLAFTAAAGETIAFGVRGFIDALRKMATPR